MTTKRKQLSGAQKRARARLKAITERQNLAAGGTVSSVLLPRVPTERELESLTGTARESARCYREWRQGRLTRDEYLTATRGLSEHRGNLLALEQERQREEI